MAGGNKDEKPGHRNVNNPGPILPGMMQAVRAGEISTEFNNACVIELIAAPPVLTVIPRSYCCVDRNIPDLGDIFIYACGVANDIVSVMEPMTYN